MNNKIANDLIRYAELVEDGALISPEEMNCASVMRLAAEYLVQPEHSATHGEPVAFPEGKKLILVDSSFDDLMYWLERCERKGHLENCADLIEPWEKFDYRDFTHPPVPTAKPKKPEQEPVAVYGYCPECGAKGVMRERRLNGNDKCASGHTYPSREAVAIPQPKEPKQEPVKWIPIEQPYPQTKSIDILMGDGSILCAVLPQFNGDLWWEGSGIGEKFIDPKYANVTHWRIHGETTTPYVATPRPQRKPWVSLSEEDREQHRDSWRSNIHDQEIKAIEAKLRELNEAPQLKPLTDEQIEKCFALSAGTFVSAGRAIEAAHGIKE